MAKELTAAGADTILLEAGSKGRLEDLYIHDWAYDLPRHGFGLSKQASLYPDGIASDIEYRGTRISIDRIRTLGGRTFHWNAVCLRFSPDDFREHSVNGIEDDWPLRYEELAPFYDYAEREMHVFGTRENLAVLPDGRLASGGDDGKIKLWPKEGGSQPLVLLQGSPVFSLATLSDGRLASGGKDGTIKLWPENGPVDEPVVLSGNGSVYSLAALAGGRLASATGDDKIRLWEDGVGEPVVLSTDDEVLALVALVDGRLASGGGTARSSCGLRTERASR